MSKGANAAPSCVSLVPIKTLRQWSVENASPGSVLWPIIAGYYTSGFITFDSSSPNPKYCLNSSTNTYYGSSAITYATWTNYDGTQTILTDTKYNGQPQTPNISSCQPADRGTVFESRDGSDLAFIAPGDIYDGSSGTINGTLVTRDGTKYITGGNNDPYVSQIQDRNGNTINFAFTSTANGGIYTITDPIGRQSTINFTENLSTDAQDVITYPGFNGGTRKITVNYSLLGGTDAQTGVPALASGESLQTYHALFPNLTGASSSTQFNPYVISSIVLADGTSYRMQYNSYGELARLTLPTGGAYGYKYSEAYNGGSNGVITLQSNAGYRIFRPLQERDEYSDGVNVSARMELQVTATTSGSRPATLRNAVFENASGIALRTERHYFYGNPQSTAAPPPGGRYADWWQGLEYETDIVGGGSSESVQRAYQQRPWAASETNQWFSTTADAEPLHDPQLCQANTTMEGGPTSAVGYFYDQYNNATDVFEYDFGAAPATGCPSSPPNGWFRHTSTQYETGSYVNSSPHLLSLPSQTAVLNGAGQAYSAASYSYDGKGNVLSVAQCATAPLPFTVSGCPAATTTFQYDSYGNILKITDANNHATSFSYADSYSDGNNGRNTNAHATAITNANNQQQKIQYDYNTGQPTLVTDANGIQTAYSYSDPLNRLTQVYHAEGTGVQNQTNYLYPSSTEVDIYQDQAQNGDRALRTQITHDGLGRLTETRLWESGSSYVTTLQSYDGLGRLYQISNPVRLGDTPNYTTYQYDSLGRTLTVTTPDGAVAQNSYNSSCTNDDPVGNLLTRWMHRASRQVQLQCAEPDDGHVVLGCDAERSVLV